MMAYVSYYEVGLENGGLRARLGAGPADEIIQRSQTDPCLRICLREPSDDSVRFRARFGVAELTPEGPVPVPQNDPSQQLGAWVRLLPIGSRIWAALHHACGNDRLDPAISTGLTTGWLMVDGDVIEAVDSSTARTALADSTLDPQEAGVFVRLGGTPEQVTLVLALLDAETT